MDRENKGHLISLYENTLKDLVSYFDKSPNTDVFKEIRIVKVVNPSSNPFRFGIEVDGRTLKISEEYTDLAEGIIYREAFAHFFPEAVSEVHEVFDLAMYFAYDRLRNEQKDRWMEIWKEISKPVVIAPNISYNAPYSFPIFDSLSGKAFLREVIYALSEFDKYKLKITREEFFEFMEDFMSGYTPKFNISETNFLQEIVTNPEATEQEIASSLRTSVSAISGIVKKLRRWHVLTRRVTVGISSLGLNYYFIYAEFSKVDARRKFIETIRKSKYLYQIFEALDGDMPIIAMFIAPNAHWFEEKLRLFVAEKRRKKEADAINYFVARKYARFYNFNDYSTKEKKWAVRYYTWFLWIKKMMEQNQRIMTFPMTKIRRVELPIKLDKTDMEIINYIITTQDMRIATLRKQFRKGTNVIQSKIKNFLKYGILRKHIMLQNIGLNDVVIMISKCSEEEAEFYKSVFDFLPYNLTYFVEGEHEGCISILRLPTGTAAEFLIYAKKVFKEQTNNKFYIVNPRIGSYWNFPKDLWDEKNQTWKIHDDIFSKNSYKE